MIIKTFEEISRMLGQSFEGENVRIKGVCTDTRQIQKGNLFIPLIGENFDGHDFAEMALKQGAAAVLWSSDTKKAPEGMPVIKVADSLKALQKLSECYRDELDLYMIAVTGSNGKTSTKDMLASILATEYKTGANQGNKNNHIGTPLTLLEFDEDTKMGVVEMGMSGFGEIGLLSNIAKPDMALITNIGEAHLADLGGSRDHIAAAKLEILEGLKEGGIFIAHNENGFVKSAVEDRKGILLSYDNNSGDYYPYDIKATQQGMSFRVAGLTEVFTVPLMGEHQVYNALAAVVCAHKIGISGNNIQKGLLNAVYTGQRGQILKAGRHIVIDDTYKSNPGALKAGIDTLSNTPFRGKKMLIIGDMRDLGAEEYALHKEIGDYISPDKVDYVITVGPAAKTIALVCQEKFSSKNVWAFEDKKSAAKQCLKVMDREETMVLVKGARVLKLEDIVKSITESY